ncbi:hypothetical protein, partial [Bacillus paranthracis]|uniref:hypothetical protein n=2 Tax=Bacillus cereus group TaxID=86661 RepID=UPI002E1CDB20|nr:hypothetical protein [Bacillus paranthracis]
QLFFNKEVVVLIVEMVRESSRLLALCKEEDIFKVLRDAGYVSITKDSFPTERIVAKVKVKPRDMLFYGISWKVIEG